MAIAPSSATTRATSCGGRSADRRGDGRAAAPRPSDGGGGGGVIAKRDSMPPGNRSVCLFMASHRISGSEFPASCGLPCPTVMAPYGRGTTVRPRVGAPARLPRPASTARPLSAAGAHAARPRAHTPWLFRVPGFRRFYGYEAGPLILVRRPLDQVSEDLVAHELCHVWQDQHRRLRMWLSYLWQGYRAERARDRGPRGREEDARP